MLTKRTTSAAGSTAIVTRVASSRGGKENAANVRDDGAKGKPLPLEQRPEFTVLMKAKVRVPGTGKDVPPHHEPKKPLPSRTEVMLARRERTAQNMSYEGILHDQLVMQKALLIRTQAASYGHDPLVVMSYVGQRAQEAVEEDVARIINELTELHGPHPTHRITAYAELSTDLGKQLESIVFDQHFDKVMQISQEFKIREEELKAREKATNQEVEVQKEEINNLVKINIELEQVRTCVYGASKALAVRYLTPVPSPTGEESDGAHDGDDEEGGGGSAARAAAGAAEAGKALSVTCTPGFLLASHSSP